MSLHQVIVNLVMNAVTHTPPSAAVSVRAAEQPEHVLLEVTDSGPGMEPEEAAHAFDRFWQADASRTRTGSGLGLSIVAGIVSSHGGDVTLDSDPVHGTTVSVLLPAAQPSE